MFTKAHKEAPIKKKVTALNGLVVKSEISEKDPEAALFMRIIVVKPQKPQPFMKFCESLLQ